MSRLFFSILFTTAVLSSAFGGNLFLDAGDLLAHGDYSAASAAYEKFAAANPGDRLESAALFNAAGIQSALLNNPDAAKKLYLQITATAADPKWKSESFRRLGDIYFQQGAVKEAFQNYFSALKNIGESDLNTPYWLTAAAESCQRCVQSGADPAFKLEACKMLSEVIPPGDAAAYCRYEYAQSLREAGQEKEAAAECYYIISYYPLSTPGQTVGVSEGELISKYYPDFNPQIFAEFAQLQGLIRRRNFTAVDSILTAVKPQIGNEGWLLNVEYANILTELYRDADYEKSLERLQEFATKNPRWGNSAEIRSMEQAIGEILQSLDQIAENPQDLGLHSQLGFALLRQGFYNLAETHFLSAVKDTVNTDAYLGLGYTYLRSGQNDKAITAVNKYLEYNPNDGNTYNLVGYAYLQINQPEEALKCFKRYRDLEPDNPNSHDSYAECLLNMGQYAEAISEYNKALELNPGWSNAIYMLGEVYRYQGDNSKALEYYQQYLQKEPQGALYQNAQAAIESIANPEKQ